MDNPVIVAMNANCDLNEDRFSRAMLGVGAFGNLDALESVFGGWGTLEETEMVETGETKIRIGQHLLQPQNHTAQEVLYRNVSS